MHPAPFNRGIELDYNVPESNKSRIWNQMENGVYIRKAIVKRVLEEGFNY